MTEIFANTKFSIVLALATSLFLISYFSFSSYKPKALRELREVKGASSNTQLDIFTLPHPQDAKNISVTKTKDSQQTTFSTQKTPNDVQSFYENILVNEWVLKEENQNNTFFARQYKKDKIFVYIWASKNTGEDKTYASVEILKYEK